MRVQLSPSPLDAPLLRGACSWQATAKTKAFFKEGFCFEESALSELELVESESNGHNQSMYYVYMIKNTKDELYTGIAENLSKRLYYHNTKQGALFTKTIRSINSLPGPEGPSGLRMAGQENKFKMVFHEGYQTLAEARKREIQIKKWRREKKENLIKRFNSGLPTKNHLKK